MHEGVVSARLGLRGWPRVAEDIIVARGSQVTFINNDSRVHTIASDPVDLHTQCPALNRVGVLNPGSTGDSGTLTPPGTCGFPDHSNTTDTTLQGRIIVE